MTDDRPQGSDSPRCYRAPFEGVCPVVHTLPNRPLIIDVWNQDEELA
jgi:hypothetical protein